MLSTFLQSQGSADSAVSESHNTQGVLNVPSGRSVRLACRLG